jgi:hypothetical protein
LSVPTKSYGQAIDRILIPPLRKAQAVSGNTMRNIQSLLLFILSTTLFSVFGCSSNTSEQGHSDTTNNQLSASVEKFKNRPIYKQLSVKIIDTTSDNDLLQVVFDNLSEKLHEDYKKEYETVLNWNKSQQAIYMIWSLEAEVNNGGFNQFYYNSSGQFYKHLPKLLSLIGAKRFSELIEKANTTFEKENPKITQHQDGSLEGFSKSYDDNPLNKFDEEFYELYKKEDLHQLQVNFIRAHRTDFINN